MLNKLQRYVVFAITFGNILEWYDIYLYIYWAPIVSKLFFHPGGGSINLFNTIAFFSLGYVFRPVGGVFFGRIGDRIGRRKTFILCILLMTIPTFILGLIPVYAQIGIFAPIILGISRILQTFPAGGELPGAFCFLYENADPKNRKFMTSFAGVGNQIGIALGALECLLMETYLPDDFLINWGWRISFMFGGLLGLLGFYLRYKLHETKLFQEMVVHHRMTRKSIGEVIGTYWKKMLTGISYGASQTVSFHLLSIIFPVYFYQSNGLTYSENLIALIIMLLLTTLPLPFFGMLGDRFGTKKFLVAASIGMLLLLYPLYTTLYSSSVASFWVIGLFVICITCITAFWPFLISHLFPTPVRYTCVGLSFNIADGFFGGVSANAILFLIYLSGDPGALLWILLAACLISFASFLRIKEVAR